jgi:hypothetical protein
VPGLTVEPVGMENLREFAVTKRKGFADGVYWRQRYLFC